MYLDLSAVTRNNGFQIPLAVVYFILSQRCIFGSGSCIKATILDRKEPRNEFLDGDVIVELEALSELQCWDYCLRHAQCKAYNYQSGRQDKPLKTCQLLSSGSGLTKSKEQNDSDRKATCVAEERSPRDKLINFSFNKEYLEKRSQENADEINTEVIRK